MTVFLAALSGAAHGQSKPVKISLTPASTTPAGYIVEQMPRAGCPNVTVTLDVPNADYILDAKGGIFEEEQTGRARWTLFNKNGDAVFSTTTHTKTAVKNVCKYILEATR